MSKPFNLEEFKAGREAVTRDGRRASFEYLSDGDIKYRLIVRIDGLTVLVAYSVDGFVAPLYQSDFDLIRMAPVRRELWARAYEITDKHGTRNGVIDVDKDGNTRLHTLNCNDGFEWLAPAVLIHSWEEE
ncbi:MAG: hypothetical protein ACRBC3_19810 [Burkholderiaceae bacterium]